MGLGPGALGGTAWSQLISHPQRPNGDFSALSPDSSRLQGGGRGTFVLEVEEHRVPLSTSLLAAKASFAVIHLGPPLPQVRERWMGPGARGAAL
jgi:hypothetical protein